MTTYPEPIPRMTGLLVPALTVLGNPRGKRASRAGVPRGVLPRVPAALVSRPAWKRQG
jgi:hypothetical protein